MKRYLLAATLGSFFLCSATSPAQTIGPAEHPYSVRLSYVIASDGEEQPGAVEQIQQTANLLRDWYEHQMFVNGFGYKTFRLETEPDGITPLVHVVHSSHDTSWHLADDANNLWTEIWGRARTAVWEKGGDIFNPEALWLTWNEPHRMNSDGTIIQWIGGGVDNGCVRDTLFLRRHRPEFLTDERTYNGLILPEFGPHPLVHDTSFWGPDGSTLSQINSVAMGSTFHEFGHALGLAHDFRNDANFNGSLMGNGFRGMRGFFYPEQYPGNTTRLSYSTASELSLSRFFNFSNTFTDNTLPTVIIHTTGTVDTVDGKLEVEFTVSDDMELAWATLRSGYNSVENIELSGTFFSGTFSTPYFTNDVDEIISVEVIDAQGNLSNIDITLRSTQPANYAPRANIKADQSHVQMGQQLTFDAYGSYDLNHASSQLTVEWDTNHDGVYDTAASTVKTLDITFTQPGHHKVSARVTDPDGAWSISVPISLYVYEDQDADGIPSDWEVRNGLDPTIASDALANDDGDIYNNLQEYRNWSDMNTYDDPLSDYHTMTVAGTFQGGNEAAGNMTLVSNFIWKTELSLLNESNVRFKFVGDSSWDYNWGDSDQTDFNIALSGTAEQGQQPDITANETLSGTYRFTFNELTGDYNVEQTASGLPLQWIGNSFHWPFNGSIEPDNDIWVNIESFPMGSALGVQVVYSVDGTTWLTADLEPNGSQGNNDLWHVDLGTFGPGTAIQYAINVWDNSVSLWDSNNGQDYFAIVNQGDPLQWIGNVFHWPFNGNIGPSDDLWINAESWPAGAGSSAIVRYTTDGWNSFQDIDLIEADPFGNNDHWYVNIGAFPSGTHVEYAIRIMDGVGVEWWETDGGANYHGWVE